MISDTKQTALHQFFVQSNKPKQSKKLICYPGYRFNRLSQKNRGGRAFFQSVAPAGGAGGNSSRTAATSIRQTLDLYARNFSPLVPELSPMDGRFDFPVSLFHLLSGNSPRGHGYMGPSHLSHCFSLASSISKQISPILHGTVYKFSSFERRFNEKFG